MIDEEASISEPADQMQPDEESKKGFQASPHSSRDQEESSSGVRYDPDDPDYEKKVQALLGSSSDTKSIPEGDQRKSSHRAEKSASIKNEGNSMRPNKQMSSSVSSGKSVTGGLWNRLTKTVRKSLISLTKETIDSIVPPED